MLEKIKFLKTFIFEFIDSMAHLYKKSDIFLCLH